MKDLKASKYRMSLFLDAKARAELTLAMLEDVLLPLKSSAGIEKILVVTPDQKVMELATAYGADILDEGYSKGLNQAVKMAISRCMELGAEAVLIVHADIPLIVSEDVEAIIKHGMVKPLVLVPSRKEDGTNVMFMRPPNLMEPSYGRESFRAHKQRAGELQINYSIFKSERLGLDIDTGDDLEALLSMSFPKKRSRTQELLKGYLKLN